MIKKENVSPQEISWIKSNSNRLSRNKSICNLYYPETIEEFVNLILLIRSSKESYDLIGCSSNTLFLPSYKVNNLICTKKLKEVVEKDNLIICDCGVLVSSLSKKMIEKGYVGFEGLNDLPGTIAAAVYGNCGCRGCSVNSILHHVEFMQEDGKIVLLFPEQLDLKYRSTSLKRGELKGVILKVYLNINQGNAVELKKIAEKNHSIRKSLQPSGVNNLGTTFNGGSSPTIKGLIIRLLQWFVSIAIGCTDIRKVYPKTLKLIGKKKFVPYVYYWNRYMFLDEKAHDLFDEYYDFLKTLYKDVRLEIEIRK